MLLQKKSVRRYKGLASWHLYAPYLRFSCNFNYVMKQKNRFCLSAVAFPLAFHRPEAKLCKSFDVTLCSAVMHTVRWPGNRVSFEMLQALEEQVAWDSHAWESYFRV